MNRATLGLLAGWTGSLAATRLLGSLLYDVKPTDPAVMALAIACWQVLR